MKILVDAIKGIQYERVQSKRASPNSCIMHTGRTLQVHAQLLRELHLHSHCDVNSAISMYGLLLESIACTIRERYGDSVWHEINERAGLTSGQTSFSVHKVYDEDVFLNIAHAASEVKHNDIFCLPSSYCVS